MRECLTGLTIEIPAVLVDERCLDDEWDSVSTGVLPPSDLNDDLALNEHQRSESSTPCLPGNARVITRGAWQHQAISLTESTPSGFYPAFDKGKNRERDTADFLRSRLQEEVELRQG
eukprot:CAMPEP_0172443340 /NCGR_PEP_ID=MMETSP1065-20121228/3626_1 /TAXON_ID=265537 /ORGANISM="Amphiprora paludosa, Strain CCMP125" /LENGTH=116 /DNA_ID=CAMNT_0013193549 /DNA_START=51 /DNA_END=402 /DNA_ORIENTATION=-